MARSGKRYNAARASYDKYAAYQPEQAVELVKQMATASFDETVEAAYRLGIDARKADQGLRGTVSLPHGTGKTVRVAVFASGDRQNEAEQAGAEVVGGEELVESIAGGGELAFDVAIATPDMMPKVGKLGKVLGPRGLMPNPKSGTVTMEVGRTVEEFKGGRIEYRNDRLGNVAAPIGRASFEARSLFENLAALTAEILRAKPASAKGAYVRNLSLSSTMGPGVKVDVSRLDRLTA